MDSTSLDDGDEYGDAILAPTYKTVEYSVITTYKIILLVIMLFM